MSWLVEVFGQTLGQLSAMTVSYSLRFAVSFYSSTIRPGFSLHKV